MPSSVIHDFEYNAAARTLRIRYVSGAVYEYVNVPERVYTGIKNADSKGTYLNRRIKGYYKYRRIS